MKKIINKFLPFVSSASFAVAYLVVATTCRTMLYQPQTPAKLLEQDK